MLLFLLLLGLVLLLTAFATAYGLRKECSRGALALILVAPLGDGILTYVLLDWFDYASVTSLVGGLMFGLLSLYGIQALVSSRRLLGSRLAWQQLNRRKRQAALLIAGLMVGSAIISSSLIVGDSLDQTVREEVEAAWGDTDVLISGYDPSVGQVTEIPQSIVEDLRNKNLENVERFQAGRVLSTAVVTSEGKANPSVPWFALEHNDDVRIGSMTEGLTWFELEEINRFSSTPQVVVNQMFVDELDVEVGDEVQFQWSVRNQNGIERTKENFTIHQIVAMDGQGQLAGTTSPAVFTDLLSAQSWQKSEGNVTSIRVSLNAADERYAVEPIMHELVQALNQSIGVDESGLQLIAESDAVTIASTNGLGRLAPRLVQSLGENRSVLTPQAGMMEVLQVPLVGLQSSSSNLLTLADGDVDGLALESEVLWHWGPGGFGFETNETSWVWRVPNGDIINDVSVHDGFGFAAYTDGLVLGNSSDDGATDYILEDSNIVAVASTSLHWYAVEEGASPRLWFGNLENGSRESLPIGVDVPPTVLEWELAQDGDWLYLRIEGILSQTYYKRSILNLLEPFIEINADDWPNQSSTSPDVCSDSGIVYNESNAWCVEEHGLVLRSISDASIQSIRLPILSDAGGFGTLPQMFFAFDGDASTLKVQQGETRIGQRLEPLSAINSGNITVSGLFQYAFGSDESVNLTINGSFVDDARLSSLSDLDPVILGLINMSDAESLASADEGERSMLIFSNVSDVEMSAIEQHLDSLVGIDELSLSVQAVKIDALEQAEASSGVLSAMFLVFGSFTIAAGVLLVVTIITMLIDVRQKEYATVRALGMTRSDLRYVAMVEGAIAATIGCGAGSLLGVSLAWLIGNGFSSVFATAGADVFSFHVDSSSLLAGWFWGFHIAMLTLYCSALWSSRMIIVHALKNVPQRVPKYVPWGVYLFIIGALGMILLSAGLFLLGSGSLAHSIWIVFGCSIVVFVCPILFWILPVLRAKRAPDGSLPTFREAPRKTIGFAGLFLLLWTGLPSSLDPVRADLSPNEFSFIVIGLVQVFAGVFVLAALAPLMIRGLLRLASFRSGPVIPVALSYPLHKPMRTAVVMGMFSITVFSVVVLSGYTLQFENYSSSFVEESEGEFELMLSAARSRPLDLEGPIEDWSLENTDISQIDAVGRVYRAQAFIENSDAERSPYILRGVDADFADHGGLPLHLWHDSLGNSSDEAWSTMHERGDVVFVDASFGLESALDGASVGVFSVLVGENMTIIDAQQPSHRREVMIGGILEQSSYLFSAGVWMPSEAVVEQYEGSLTRVYVSVSEESQASSSFDSSDVRYFAAAGKSSEEREAATELSENLRSDLEKDGVDVSLIAEDVALIQALVLSILALFEGYLAIGLMIGIAGIGVVTYRSVSERRKHIGMLRALGFTKKMVTRVHLIEIAWVSMLGILNGVAVALMFHVGLHSAIWEKEGAVLVLPWSAVAWVLLGGAVLVYLATLSPVRAATRIEPSEALRS